MMSCTHSTPQSWSGQAWKELDQVWPIYQVTQQKASIQEMLPLTSVEAYYGDAYVIR